MLHVGNTPFSEPVAECFRVKVLPLCRVLLKRAQLEHERTHSRGCAGRAGSAGVGEEHSGPGPGWPGGGVLAAGAGDGVSWVSGEHLWARCLASILPAALGGVLISPLHFTIFSWNNSNIQRAAEGSSRACRGPPALQLQSSSVSCAGALPGFYERSRR